MDKRKLPDLLEEPAEDSSLFDDCQLSGRAIAVALAATLIIATLTLGLAAFVTPVVPALVLLFAGLGVLLVAGYLARDH